MATKKITTTKGKKSLKSAKPNRTFAFGKMNYLIMILGVIVIGIGYLLLAGGASTDANTFSEELFSSQRLTVAPLTILVGLAIEFFAIFYRPRTKAEEKTSTEE